MSGMVNSALNVLSYVVAGVNLSSKNNRDTVASLTLLNSVRQIEAVNTVNETLYEGFDDITEGLGDINENITELRKGTLAGFDVLYRSSIDIRNSIEAWGSKTVNAINQFRNEARVFYAESLRNQEIIIHNQKITHQKLDQISQLLKLNLNEQIKQTVALENPEQVRSLEKLNTALKKIKLFEKNLSEQTLNDAINSCDEAISLDPFNEAAYFYSAKWLVIKNTMNLSDDTSWKERYIESKNRTIIELDNSIASQKKLAEENSKRLSIAVSIDLINNLDFKLFRKEFYSFAKKHCPEDFLIYIEAFNFYALCFDNKSEKTFEHFQKAVKRFGYDAFLQVVWENTIAISAIGVKNPSILNFCLTKLRDFEDSKLQDFMFSLSNEAGKLSKFNMQTTEDELELEQNSFKPIKFKSLNTFEELDDNHFNIYKWRIDNIPFIEEEILSQKRDISIPMILQEIESTISRFEKDLKLLKYKNDELNKANTNYRNELKASSDLIHEVISKKEISPNKIKYIEEIERAINRILRLLNRDRSDKKLKEDSIFYLEEGLKNTFDENIVRLINLSDFIHFEDINFPQEYYDTNDMIAMNEKFIEEKVTESKKIYEGFDLKKISNYWLPFGLFIWWWQGMTVFFIYLSIILLGYIVIHFKKEKKLKEIDSNLAEKKSQTNSFLTQSNKVSSSLAQEVIARRKTNLLKNLSDEDLLSYPVINKYLRMVFDASQEFDKRRHLVRQWKQNSKIFYEIKDSFNFEALLHDLKKLKKNF